MITIDNFSNIKTQRYSSASNNSIDIVCDIQGIGNAILFTAAKTESTL